MVVADFFFEARLCISFTESAKSIIEAHDLSSQGVAIESDGLALGVLRYVVFVYYHVGSLQEQHDR